MAPCQTRSETLLGESTTEPLAEKTTPSASVASDAGVADVRQKIIWWRVAFALSTVVSAGYGFYLTLYSAKWATVFYAVGLYFFCGFGITAGAHRLWTHRSFKASWPLRVVLAIGYTLSLQYSLLEWVRMHRVHHKYSETDADPHNASRGFFYSHVGWLLVEMHPEYRRRAKEVPVDDLLRDPIVVFQYRYYVPLVVLTVVVPVWAACFLWNESLITSLFVVFFLRIFCNLNSTFSVNSFAHMIGNHPYDKHINPADNWMVALPSLGEGWHNYHHAFPSDYRTSELGDYAFNYTTAIIDACHRLGLATDLKTMSRHLVYSRAQRTGDGSHPSSHPRH